MKPLGSSDQLVDRAYLLYIGDTVDIGDASSFGGKMFTGSR